MDKVILNLAYLFSFVLILGAALLGEYLFTKYKEKEPEIRRSVIQTRTTFRPILRKIQFELLSRTLALQHWARSRKQ